jgi:hypothetical protein
MPAAPPLESLCAQIALGISRGYACHEKETIREVERRQVQAFSREEMSVSYRQHIDVNVKKLTKVSLAALGAIDILQTNLIK